MSVVGRYAPSPTGALHLGNLRTAVAAWASAKSRGGSCLLRIEDLDRPRCRAEFESSQLADLTALGLTWDSDVIRQSLRNDVYTEQLDRLRRLRLAYPCFCSRKDIAAAASAPHGPSGMSYPGTCARLTDADAADRIAAGEQHCWRLRVDESPTRFFDGFAGETAIDLRQDGGDFVIRRSDGLFAYQFACAVDDALSGVNEVVRANDLLDSGARQAYLLACLRLPVPRYLHIPLMTGPDGARLAKRIGSEDMSGILARGHDATAIFSYLAWTLGQCELGERLAPRELAGRWNWQRVPRGNVVFDETALAAFAARKGAGHGS